MTFRDAPTTDELASGREEPTGVGRIPARVRQAVLVLAALVAAAVFGPGLLSSSSENEPSATKSPSASPTRASSPTPSARPGPLAWKTRGNLREDSAFLSAALSRARRENPSSDTVLFAATLPGGHRLALIALTDGVPSSPVQEQAGVFAVSVAPNRSVEDGRLEGVSGLSSVDGVVGWAGELSRGNVYAVVLGRPAPLEAEISASIRYEPDGSATRDWQPIEGPDGVAVVDLGTRVDPVVALRSRVGIEPEHRLMEVSRKDGDPLELVLPEPDAIAGLEDPGYAGPEPSTVALAVAQGLREFLDVETADLRLIWDGPGALVRAKRPDGPTFHLLMIEGENPDEGPITEVRRVPWHLADEMPWLGSSPEGDFVINPSGAGSVLITNDGSSSTVRIGRGGFADFDIPGGVFQLGGAEVVVRSPSGRVVLRTDLPVPFGQDLQVLNQP